MTDQATSQYRSAGRAREASGWAVSFTLFAAIMIIMSGTFQALAVLSAIANFLFLPYYPFWALTVITLDVFIIWALTVHGRDLQATDA